MPTPINPPNPPEIPVTLEPNTPAPIDPPDSTLPIEDPLKAPPVKDPEPV